MALPAIDHCLVTTIKNVVLKLKKTAKRSSKWTDPSPDHVLRNDSKHRRGSMHDIGGSMPDTAARRRPVGYSRVVRALMWGRDHGACNNIARTLAAAYALAFETAPRWPGLCTTLVLWYFRERQIEWSWTVRCKMLLCTMI